MNKPQDWTSFDVVAKLRNLLRWKKVGHAGTLDPMATGVLLLLLGSATRRSGEFMDLPKEYRATIRFGLTTTSDDITGDVVAETEVGDWSELRIREALQNYRGVIDQIPPQVSAIKVGGKRSYKEVLAGRAPQLAARKVEIYSLEILSVNEPELELLIRCGRGTYIRSLARDLGRDLNWGGTLSALTRTAIGPYRVENSFSMDDIAKHKHDFIGTV